MKGIDIIDEMREIFFLISIGVIFILFAFVIMKILQKLKPDTGNKELLIYLEQLKTGQQKLSGVVEILSNNQTASNSHLIGHMEVRLSEVQKQIFDSLNGSATKTAQSLGALHRLFSRVPHVGQL